MLARPGPKRGGGLLLPVILFHHSNVRVPPRLDAALRWLIVTPWMHWVHHSNWQPETDSNFASILSVWDRLFRTFGIREDPLKITLGLEDDKGGGLRRWRPKRYTGAVTGKEAPRVRET